MLNSLKHLWGNVSYLGVDLQEMGAIREERRKVFFNQILTVGLFATALQVAYVWLFIGSISLLFFSISILSALCLYLNSKGYFHITKVLFVYFVYGVGVLFTFLLGNDGYFHIGVISTFIFGLIIFDKRKEIVYILGGIPVVLLVFAIGEFEYFGAPDFSEHPYLGLAKASNLANLFIINGILTYFLINLNKKNEEKLSIAIQEKDELLKKLEEGNNRLESIVQERTSEISNQKNILIQQNEEKEILLKEVHHRVKNNLQIIVSLINLQLSKFDNKEVEAALRETQSRVLSMSLVHKKMYQTSNFKEIGIRLYTEQLIENINALYVERDFIYQIDIDDSIALDVETAIPFGLIINEIITNFFKHCRTKDSEKNEFYLILKKSVSNKLIITYRDNGPGFNNELSIDDTASLGLQLIDSLTEQINGEFRFYTDHGAVYEFSMETK